MVSLIFPQRAWIPDLQCHDLASRCSAWPIFVGTVAFASDIMERMLHKGSGATVTGHTDQGDTRSGGKGACALARAAGFYLCGANPYNGV